MKKHKFPFEELASPREELMRRMVVNGVHWGKPSVRIMTNTKREREEKLLQALWTDLLNSGDVNEEFNMVAGPPRTELWIKEGMKCNWIFITAACMPPSFLAELFIAGARCPTSIFDDLEDGEIPISIGNRRILERALYERQPN